LQIDSPRPPVKNHILFLFSEKIGFKAYYDKKYYAVNFPEFLNKDKKAHLPQVIKRLIHDSFFAGAKVSELADRAGGACFARELAALRDERIARY
jgi:hypothetical protein